MKFLLVLLAFLAAALLLWLLYGRERGWEMLAGPADLGRYDFAESRRRTSGNDALACTEGLCAAPDFPVPASASPPAEAVAGLARRLAAMEPDLTRVDDGADPGYARFVVYTRLMRFPDTVDIAARVLPDGSTGIAAYSRSKLGSKDFGVNRRRLEALFDRS